jgi:hypothetical protein
MSRTISIPLPALGMALLCGCAATAQSSSTPPGREPDCSFRSATTCWTVAGRFPAPRPVVQDSVPEEVLEQPPMLLAKMADTATASR